MLMRPDLSKKLREFETRHGARQQSGGALRQRCSSDATTTRVKTLSIKHCGHLGDKIVRYHENPSVAIRSLNHKIKTHISKYNL